MDKPIDWRGSSLDDLREFPEPARKMAGQELRKPQRGETPDDRRPFPELGPGVNEIRIDCADGLVQSDVRREVCGSDLRPAQLPEFEVKTSKADVAIAEARYRAVVREMMGSK